MRHRGGKFVFSDFWKPNTQPITLGFSFQGEDFDAAAASPP
jgi:hypothetical protein